MITEDYISLETAKLLKEKGFDEATIGYYYTISEIPEKIKFFDSPISIYYSEGLIGCIQAPTLQMAMKWLRKEHNLAISVSVTVDGWHSYVSQIKLDSEGFVVDIIDGIDNGNIPNYGTYEEACEAAIKYCLENLI